MKIPLKIIGYSLTVPSLLCQPSLPSPPTRTSCYMYGLHCVRPELCKYNVTHGEWLKTDIRFFKIQTMLFDIWP